MGLFTVKGREGGRLHKTVSYTGTQSCITKS